MSSFYSTQNEIMDAIDTIDTHIKEGKEYQERLNKITIYGYTLSELLDIITFAKEKGYKSNSELKD